MIFQNFVRAFLKAVGHRYIKRIPYTTPKGRRYRYIYRTTSTHRGRHAFDEAHLVEGTKFALHGQGESEFHGHITKVEGDMIQYVIDDGPRKGETVTTSRQRLVDELNLVHGVQDKLIAERAKVKDAIAEAKRAGHGGVVRRLERRLRALGGEPEAQSAEPEAKNPLVEKIRELYADSLYSIKEFDAKELTAYRRLRAGKPLPKSASKYAHDQVLRTVGLAIRDVLLANTKTESERAQKKAELNRLTLDRFAEQVIRENKIDVDADTTGLDLRLQLASRIKGTKGAREQVAPEAQPAEPEPEAQPAEPVESAAPKPKKRAPRAARPKTHGSTLSDANRETLGDLSDDAQRRINDGRLSNPDDALFDMRRSPEGQALSTRIDRALRRVEDPKKLFRGIPAQVVADLRSPDDRDFVLFGQAVESRDGGLRTPRLFLSEMKNVQGKELNPINVEPSEGGATFKLYTTSDMTSPDGKVSVAFGTVTGPDGKRQNGIFMVDTTTGRRARIHDTVKPHQAPFVLSALARNNRVASALANVDVNDEASMRFLRSGISLSTITGAQQTGDFSEAITRILAQE